MGDPQRLLRRQCQQTGTFHGPQRLHGHAGEIADVGGRGPAGSGQKLHHRLPGGSAAGLYGSQCLFGIHGQRGHVSRPVARLPVGGGLVGDGALLFQGPQHGAHAASAGFFQLLQLRLAAGGLKRGDGRKGARRPPAALGIAGRVRLRQAPDLPQAEPEACRQQRPGRLEQRAEVAAPGATAPGRCRPHPAPAGGPGPPSMA